jgi:transposase
VPAGLWEIVRPLLPPPRVRPQGGGTQNLADETAFAAIVYVLTSGCAWRHLPPCFGMSKSTVHRRFVIWSRAGVWGRLHQVVLTELANRKLLDLSRTLLDTAHVRAKKGANTQSEPRGPGQTGFQAAHRVRWAGNAPRGRYLRRAATVRPEYRAPSYPLCVGTYVPPGPEYRKTCP